MQYSLVYFVDNFLINNRRRLKLFQGYSRLFLTCQDVANRNYPIINLYNNYYKNYLLLLLLRLLLLSIKIIID